MTATDPLIGTQLANFQVVRVLGRGGMATVYYGWDVKLERPVAIKVIDARYRDNPAYARRFINEAQAVAALRHENILQIHYADKEDGLYYFVMEYVRGPDLGQLLENYTFAGERMDPRDVLRIARAIAAALDYAHARGVIHRDVKPANVLVVAEDGRVFLTDFGLAMNVELGTRGDVFGSPHYIAPEQARSSAEAVPESDLYALGVMLYEMLAGVVPFDDPSPTTLALKHLNEEAPPPSRANPRLGAEVDRLFAKALAKAPEARYRSGRELVEALEAALGELPDPVDPVPTLPELPDDNGKAAVPNAKPAPSVTLAELTGRYMAEHLPVEAVAPPLERAESRRAIPPRRLSVDALRKLGPWALGSGGCIILLIVVGVALLLSGSALFNRNDSQGRSPEATESAEATAEPRSEPAGSPAPRPTPLQEGDYHEAYYDETAFYLRNLSGNDRPIAPLAFERVLNNGNFTDLFEGRRWSEFYSIHEEGLCLVIEIINYEDHLDPRECHNRHVVTRTPTLEEAEEYDFWIKQQGSKEFRVLWNGVEVARCEIDEGFCEIYLP